jgi:fatty acid kinase fatty acid binding subunit
MGNAERTMPGARSQEVAIVTDSTTYLPRALIDRWSITTVSLYVGWNGELRPEHEYVDLDAFYARLRDSPQLPKTSQPSVGDFLAVYRPLLEQGRDVVSLHLAEALSGTSQSAREAAAMLAAEGLGARVSVHDAQTGAGGLGLLVVVAAELAQGGCSAEAILEGVRAARASLGMWFCLDTLEYLRRGGRIGAAQAAVGSALKVKPILTFGSEIAPVGRVRTHRRALERMTEYLRELRDSGAHAWIVQHAQSPDDADRLVQAGQELFGFDPLFCSQVGPVLGAHLGAGVLVGGLSPPSPDLREPSGT